MESKANYTLVGLFTLGVIALIFAFVLWFAKSGDQSTRLEYRIVFSGSVSGLTRGAVVRFNGLPVGEVVKLEILPSDPGKVVGTIQVEQTTPMRSDTRARLEYQGLTGVASVQLNGGDANAPKLTTLDKNASPIVYADRSDYQDIMETVQRLAGKVDSVLSRADAVLAQSEGSVVATVRNVEAFSRALSDNASNISAFMANIGEMSQKVGTLSTRLERFVDSAEAIVKTVDTQAINTAITNVSKFSEALGSRQQSVGTMLDDTGALVASLKGSAAQLDRTLVDVGNLARAIDAAKLNQTLEGASKFSDVLGRNALNVDRILTDASLTAQRVSEASARLQNVMAGAEKFFGEGQNGAATGALNEIAETAKAIRLLALNLDKRTMEITAGINRFTGPGLRDLEALSTETRRAVGDLSRAARNFERNPQQLLLGNRPAMPEYRP